MICFLREFLAQAQARCLPSGLPNRPVSAGGDGFCPGSAQC